MPRGAQSRVDLQVSINGTSRKLAGSANSRIALVLESAGVSCTC
jgi:hypothetical protein